GNRTCSSGMRLSATRVGIRFLPWLLRVAVPAKQPRLPLTLHAVAAGRTGPSLWQTRFRSSASGVLDVELPAAIEGGRPARDRQDLVDDLVILGQRKQAALIRCAKIARLDLDLVKDRSGRLQHLAIVALQHVAILLGLDLAHGAVGHLVAVGCRDVRAI